MKSPQGVKSPKKVRIQNRAKNLLKSENKLNAKVNQKMKNVKISIVNLKVEKMMKTKQFN